jgi:polyisoprenyl-teichoic acid--peptidoglycan teichoic acid transferase
MPDPSSSPRTPYRRPTSADGGDRDSRHRRGVHSGVHLTLRARRWPRRTLVGVNVVVALALIATASAFAYVNWRFGQVHRVSVPAITSSKAAGGGKPFTLLVVGSDSRAALSDSPANAQFGGSSVSGQRSDTIIVVRVVPKTRQLMMLSIPRDLWGAIPGQGDNRINSAFDTGPNLLIQTIQADLGIPINHFVEINFDTFQDITTAVGGVRVYFPTPAKDAYSLLSIPAAGCYNLSGAQALAFVRSRHYEYYQDGEWQFESASDLARIQRQQAFIKKMISKAEGEFTNPIAINGVIGGITKNLTVDKGFSPSLMLNLAAYFHSMSVSGIPDVTLPTYGFTTAGGAEVLGLQQPQAAQTIAAFKAFGNPTPKTPAPKTPAPKTPAAKPSSSHPADTLPPVTMAPGSVSIEVANGTGTTGQAGRMTQALAAFGYHAGIVASPGVGYATTEIRYAPDSRTAAQQVAARINGGATLVEDAALTPSPYNLEVITGSTFAGSSAGGTSRSSTSTSATTATTVPGTNSAVYELPGSTGPPPASC